MESSPKVLPLDVDRYRLRELQPPCNSPPLINISFQLKHSQSQRNPHALPSALLSRVGLRSMGLVFQTTCTTFRETTIIYVLICLGYWNWLVATRVVTELVSEPKFTRLHYLRGSQSSDSIGLYGIVESAPVGLS